MDVRASPETRKTSQLCKGSDMRFYLRGLPLHGVLTKATVGINPGQAENDPSEIAPIEAVLDLLVAECTRIAFD
jgi:hypothetical protein